jgi:hypothetical protein
MSTPLAALLLVVLTASGRADEGTASPTVDWTVDGAITGGMLALWGVSELASGTLSPPRCRWCGTPGAMWISRENVRSCCMIACG